MCQGIEEAPAPMRVSSTVSTSQTELGRPLTVIVSWSPMDVTTLMVTPP